MKQLLTIAGLTLAAILAAVLISRCVTDRCERNASFYLKGTTADCGGAK